MDWKTLTLKAKDISDKAKPFLDKTLDKTKELATKADPIVKRAKSYGSSAVGFFGKQIEQTPMFIRTEEEYNLLRTAKRSILIAYDSHDTVSESVRLMMPIWATQAWTDAAELKYIEIQNNEALAKLLQIQGPIEMRITYMEQETNKLHTLDTIKKWWNLRDYKGGAHTEATGTPDDV